MPSYILQYRLQEMSDKNIEMSNENNTVYSVSIVYTLASILILIWLLENKWTNKSHLLLLVCSFQNVKYKQ